MEHVDRAVLEAIGGSVLRPAVVQAVIDGVVKALNATTKPGDITRYRRELASLSQEINRLTDAIAAGGPLSSLLEALNARQSRHSELSAWLEAERARKNVIVDRRAIERTVSDRLADWRGLLTNHVKDARELLRRALQGPLRLTPDGRAYRFGGEAAIGRLLEGLIPVPTFGTSPARHVHILRPEFRLILPAA